MILTVTCPKCSRSASVVAPNPEQAFALMGALPDCECGTPSGKFAWADTTKYGPKSKRKLKCRSCGHVVEKHHFGSAHFGSAGCTAKRSCGPSGTFACPCELTREQAVVGARS